MKKVVVILSLVGSLFAFENAQNGEKLYTKCAVCHGFYGEKSAENLSMIIKEMSQFDFIDSIKGYQDGTYGRDINGKKVMERMVKNLSDSDISDIATYILVNK